MIICLDVVLIVIRKLPLDAWFSFLLAEADTHSSTENLRQGAQCCEAECHWPGPQVLSETLSSSNTQEAVGKYVLNASVGRRSLRESGNAREGLSQGQVQAMQTCVSHMAGGYQLSSTEYLPNSGRHSKYCTCTKLSTPLKSPLI